MTDESEREVPGGAVCGHTQSSAPSHSSNVTSCGICGMPISWHAEVDEEATQKAVDAGLDTVIYKQAKKLRAEFEERFTLKGVGCPNILDDGCTEGADGLWAWIMENFQPKDRK